MKMKSKCIIIVFVQIAVFSFAKAQPSRFNFEKLQTNSSCMEELMQNVIVVCNEFMPNAKCHYMTLSISGSDTLLEIHSYDDSGIYSRLSDNNILGSIRKQTDEFYIDGSLHYLFYPTHHHFKKKYNKKQLYGIHQSLSFNDCYLLWKFKKSKWGIELIPSDNISIFKYWYNMDLNPNCFCDYKNLIIEITEDTPEELDNTTPSSNK